MKQHTEECSLIKETTKSNSHNITCQLQEKEKRKMKN